MTSHQLAKRLLDMPDVPVVLYRSINHGPDEYYEIDTVVRSNELQFENRRGEDVQQQAIELKIA